MKKVILSSVVGLMLCSNISVADSMTEIYSCYGQGQGTAQGLATKMRMGRIKIDTKGELIERLKSEYSLSTHRLREITNRACMNAFMNGGLKVFGIKYRPSKDLK